jgi:hypothetical protein
MIQTCQAKRKRKTRKTSLSIIRMKISIKSSNNNKIE